MIFVPSARVTVRVPELVKEGTLRPQVRDDVTDDEPALESAGEFGTGAQGLFRSVRQIGANEDGAS